MSRPRIKVEILCGECGWKGFRREVQILKLYIFNKLRREYDVRYKRTCPKCDSEKLGEIGGNNGRTR